MRKLAKPQIALIALITLAICFKPIAAPLLLTVFSFEHLWFLKMAFRLLEKKQEKRYTKIHLTRVHVEGRPVIEKWDEFCKAQAFLKIYSLIARRKFNFKNLALTALVVIFGLPIRLIKIYLFFRKKNYTVEFGLSALYLDSYIKASGLAIETIDGTFELNCMTLGKILKNVCDGNIAGSRLPISQAYDLLKDLKDLSVELEKSYAPEFEEAHMYEAALDEETKLGKHYGVLNENNLAHATSKVPNNILEKQFVEPPIPSLVLPQAVKPGTIITPKILSHKKLSISKLVPKIELDNIRYSHPNLFSIGSLDFARIRNIDLEYRQILHKHLHGFKHVDEEFIKELRFGLHYPVLNHMSDAGIKDALVKWYDPLNSNWIF